MTALAGYWSFDGAPDSGERCARMLKAQQIYGPEAPATASDGAISIGQRQYSLGPGTRRLDKVASGAGGGTLLVADARLDNRGSSPKRSGSAPTSSGPCPTSA
jgi:hypothetical protein